MTWTCLNIETKLKYKNMSYIEIAYYLSIIGLLSIQILNGEVLRENSKSFQNQLLHFRKCHLRIFFTKLAYLNVEETQFYHSILSVYTNEMVFSLQNTLTESNTANFNNISRSLIIHRRLSCLVHAFLKDDKFVLNSNTLVLKREVQSSSPQFIVFLDNFVNSTKGLFVDVYEFLKISNYKLSTALVIFYNSSKAFTICWACVENLAITELSLTSTNTFTNSYKLLKVQVNLNYKLLLTDLRVSEIRKKLGSCDRSVAYNRTNLPPSLEICVLRSLDRKLNFTYRPNSHKKIPFSRLHHKIEVTDANFNAQFLTGEYQTVEFAFNLEPSSFIVIKHRRDGFNEAIAGMLDWFLWFMLLALNLSMRLSVAVSLTIIKNQVKQKDKLNLLKSFMNQGLYSHIKPFLRNWKHIRWHLLNKVVWAFTLGTLVNMAYKAKMTSFLTKHPEPSYPKDIRQVNSSGMMTKTIVTSLQRNSTYVRCDGNTKLHMTAQMDIRGMRCLTAGFFIHHKKTDRYANRKSEEFPDTFAVLGPSQYTNMQKDLMKAFVPAKWVSDVIKVDTFVIMRPFIIDRNFFYPIFKNGLASLLESGLYDRWEKYYQEMLAWRNFHSTKTAIEDLDGDATPKDFPVKMDHWHGYLLTNKMYGGTHAEGSAKQTEARPLSFLELQALWMVYGVLLVGLGITFCIEIFQTRASGSRN